MNSTEACIALNMLPTMGPVRLRKLLEVFETPERVLGEREANCEQSRESANEVADQISTGRRLSIWPRNLKRIPILVRA